MGHSILQRHSPYVGKEFRAGSLGDYSHCSGDLFKMILAVILCGKIPFEDEIRYNVTYFGRATVFLDSNLKCVPIRESDFLKIILEYRHILCA